ncbi:MAG: sugar transferase [Bdellovibrionales bacterium]
MYSANYFGSYELCIWNNSDTFSWQDRSFGDVWARNSIGLDTGFWVYALFHRLIVYRTLCTQTQGQRWLVLLSNQFVPYFAEDVYDNHQGEGYALITPEPMGNFKFDHRKLEWVGDFSKLGECAQKSWFGVIVGLDDEDLAKESEMLMQFRFLGTRPINITDYYEMKWQKIPVYFLKKSWFVFSEGFRLFHNPVGLRLKRMCDFIGALILLVLLSPIMILTWLLVIIDSPGPAIFRQVRTGQNGKDFVIYKFRSMKVDAEKDGVQWSKKGDSRITRVGKFIRKTRLDELPQILNVIRGEMSFIGPRPELPQFNRKLEKEIPHYQLRHLLKPGVSGWAQVMYPYGASTKDSTEKLKYELFYIKNYSIYLDLIIIFKTIRVILGGKGR